MNNCCIVKCKKKKQHVYRELNIRDPNNIRVTSQNAGQMIHAESYFLYSKHLSLRETLFSIRVREMPRYLINRNLVRLHGGRGVSRRVLQSRDKARLFPGTSYIATRFRALHLRSRNRGAVLPEQRCEPGRQGLRDWSRAAPFEFKRRSTVSQVRVGFIRNGFPRRRARSQQVARNNRNPKSPPKPEKGKTLISADKKVTKA